MTTVRAFAAHSAATPLGPWAIERRDPGPSDVVIDILFCGVCHTDLHIARNEWGGTTYPVVPGHEIVGRVVGVGSAVAGFRVGDPAGVGCMVDSCRMCASCLDGDEQYCEKGARYTYNAKEADGVSVTYGGYSTRVVVDERYVLRMPATLPLDEAAPLLCAGITTYSPLRHWRVTAGDRIAVVGLGGLGHMAVKLGAAMGAEVTVISTSDHKKADAVRLGASHFLNSRTADAFAGHKGRFSIIINTVSAPLDIGEYLALLRKDGTLVQVGAPPDPVAVETGGLIMGRKQFAGSLIGGIRETQEMLDFCGVHRVAADVEVIPMQQIDHAYDRMLKGDVKYRFVVDLESLRS